MEGMTSFCCAYWDWLRGKSAFEPTAAQHGLSEMDADVLRRQIEIEWKRLNP